MIDTPDCFESEQHFADWQSLSRKVPHRHSYCWDCNPVFQAESLAIGECEHPESRFYYRKIEGNIYSLEGYRGRGKNSTARPVSKRNFLRKGYWYLV